jgi:tetratricopeptide (TPR) repeat protein
MTVEFDPGRNRDAWAVFRGYVYQVNVTMDRWLQLEEGEILELERGEDVDLLGQAVAAEGAERQRLLEQVKQLEDTVTLRSAPVREFLANAHGHLRTNPSLRLRFRFTTTANAATERPTTMPGDVPGIIAWEQIRTGKWPENELSPALDATRELLTSPSAPKGVQAQAWAEFQAFVRETDTPDFVAFIKACEWSPKHVAAADYEEQLHAKLVALGIVPDRAAAGSLYDRLLAFAFRLLTQRGVKRLTRDGFLEQVALWREGVPLSPDDDRRVREIRELVRALETRMVVVESAVTELRSVTAGSAAMIDTLARQHGIAAAVEYVARVVSLEEPPQVDHASTRATTVSEIIRRRGGAGWIALHGVSGIGKSQLALLVARAVANARVWIRFRDLTIPEACLRLDAALAQLAGAVPSGSVRRAELMSVVDPRAGLSQLGRGTVIVLDDLPRYRAGDDLSVRIGEVVRAAHEEGMLIISTSAYPVPTAVLDAFAEGQVLSLPAPPFAVQEVRDVLSAYGAPQQWKGEGIAQLVHTATSGHPTLVRACARDLASRDWAADMLAIGRVLGTDFAAGVNDETVRALIDSAPDPLAREMLFRLNLVGGEFTVDEVHLLASVHPEVPHPRGHIDPLLGLWIQSDGGGRYSISPLVRPLGGSELSPDTRRSCHARIAERIVSARVMSDLEASRAITHFTSAEAYDAAGWVLLRGLFSLRDVDLYSGVRPIFAHIWLDLPLPEQMNLGVRLMVRGLQVGVCARINRDARYVREDLERLSGRAGEAEPWATFTAYMFAADALATSDVTTAGGYLVRALRLRPHVMAALQEHGFQIPDFPLEQMIWMMVPGVNSPEALMAWVDVLEQMTAEQRNLAFELNDIGRAGAAQAANSLMFAEEKKPSEDRDWWRVQDALKSTTERARAMGLFLLSDAMVVARMTILGEFLRDLTTAEALAMEVLERPGLERDTEFQVTHSLALLHYDYGSAERALDWLARAFGLRTRAYARESVRVGIFLSMRLADSDTVRAVDILAETTTWVDAHDGDVGLSGIEAYGERAVAEWLAGDRVAAYRSLDKATSLLLAAKEDTPDWKSLAVLVGHNSGYLASVAATGHPPGVLKDGEPYAAPARGLFALRPSGRDEAFSEEKSRYLLIQLAHFADAVGARDRAAHWARMAASHFRTAGRHHELLLILPILIASAVNGNDFDHALALAWEYGGVAEAIRLTRPTDPDDVTPSPIEALGPEGNERWLAAEVMALAMLVPLFFKLALDARESAGDVRSRLPTLKAALRSCAARSADPSVWHAAVDLFDEAFVASVPDQHLVARTNSYTFRHADSAMSLKTIAYLAASTRPDTRLNRSLALQLAGAQFVGQFIIPRAHAFAEISGEFYAGFWKARFGSARFLFSNPREVERGFARADAAGRDRARLVLATVASGLRAEVPDGLRRWLFGPTS